MSTKTAKPVNLSFLSTILFLDTLALPEILFRNAKVNHMKRRAVKIISCGFFGYLSLIVFFGICSNVSAQSDLSERERILLEQIEDVPSKEPTTAPSKPQWQYGGFIDLGYLLDFNHPSNQLF